MIYVLLALLLIAIPYVSKRFNLPVLNIIYRWFRWVFCAALIADILEVFLLSTRPFFVHFVTGLGFYFIIETGYNWVAIKALSGSELPLFPRYKTNKAGDGWPANLQTIKIKEWIRQEKFVHLESFKAELYAGIYLRTSIYQNPETKTRLQILFVPKGRGENEPSFILTNVNKEGASIITDNYNMPYGGFYPDTWKHLRNPLEGSLAKLKQLHDQRLKNDTTEIVPLGNEPLEDLLEQQRTLEEINIKKGFLFPRREQNEKGKITQEGRYRLWKEMWCLAYLGRPLYNQKKI